MQKKKLMQKIANAKITYTHKQKGNLVFKIINCYDRHTFPNFPENILIM